MHTPRPGIGQLWQVCSQWGPQEDLHPFVQKVQQPPALHPPTRPSQGCTGFNLPKPAQCMATHGGARDKKTEVGKGPSGV